MIDYLAKKKKGLDVLNEIKIIRNREQYKECNLLQFIVFAHISYSAAFVLLD